jgi:Tfp pilus assembly protein PilO
MQLDFLKKAKKDEIILITVAACCLILVGYYFLFLAPVTSKFLLVFRGASRVGIKLADAELSINRMPMMRKEIEELRSNEDVYSSKLPREEEFPAVLESLSDMAQNAGVKITKILPVRESLPYSNEPSHPGIYQQKEIRIDAQCGYHELGTFIAALESAKRFMEVSDIRIEVGKVNPKRHNVQLTVKTFILEGE